MANCVQQGLLPASTESCAAPQPEQQGEEKTRGRGIEQAPQLASNPTCRTSLLLHRRRVRVVVKDVFSAIRAGKAIDADGPVEDR